MKVKIIGQNIRRITTFEPFSYLVFKITYKNAKIQHRYAYKSKVVYYWKEGNVIQKEVFLRKVGLSQSYPISNDYWK